jgi:hypothetical protein
MPRDSSGNYSLPAGNPVASGSTITSSWANSTFNDVATALTDSLDRNGRGGMAGVFQNFDGTENGPGITWSNENQTGFYRAGLGDMRVSLLSQDIFRWADQTAEIWADNQWNPVLYSGSGGAIPDGTANYQTVAWSVNDTDWVPNSSLLVNYTTGNVTIAAELAVGNDITVGGTVDGRDVSNDGAKLDFHTQGVTAGGVDVHYTDAPNDGLQYARKSLGWAQVAASGEVVPPGTTDGQTLKWDTTTSAWLNTSDVIVTDAGFMGVGVLPAAKISTDGDILAGIGSLGWLGNGFVGIRGLGNTTQGMFSSALQTDIRGTDIYLDDGSLEGAFLTDGRLGIGTGNPNVASTLDVNGDIYTKGLPLVDGGATIAARFAVVASLPVTPEADTIYFVTN